MCFTLGGHFVNTHFSRFKTTKKPGVGAVGNEWRAEGWAIHVYGVRDIKRG